MKQIKRFPFTPILGWSSSRYDTFKMCQRKYYYTYYAKFDPKYSRREIDLLKTMTTIALETGNIVHDMNKVSLERLQKSEEKLNKDKYYDYVKRKTEHYCNIHKFAEIYYKEFEKINVDDISEKVKLCLDNFLESDRFNWLTTKAVQNKSEWIIEPGGYGETRIDGMKAYCKVDFLLPVNDHYYILDWKTGKEDSEKHSKQLLGYSTWASYHFEIVSEKITPIIAYMFPDYKETHVTINEFDIQKFSSRVKSETDEMTDFCDNVEENIPKAKELFSMTEKTVLCGYCNFRELCGKK